jgi:endonuclease/exonuclease/phosphatase family metal-dependent hydrolase
MVGLAAAADPVFRVATFNVENYLSLPTGTRPAKSSAAKAKVRQMIHAANADVLALQEMGSPAALEELRQALQAEGRAYPYWEHVTGFDTNIHLAVLSRFRIVERRPRTNETFLLFGRRYRVGRGFAEIDIQVNPRYNFTLITGHLKSKREVGYADQAELREEEGLVLRRLVEQRFANNPAVNLIVLGDFNDTKDAVTIRTLIGRGRTGLFDTRPVERNGDDVLPQRARTDPRQIAWTHFFEKEDTYSRIDYILLSRNMTREWLSNETHIVTAPNWGLASDHRPIVAGFSAQDQ